MNGFRPLLLLCVLGCALGGTLSAAPLCTTAPLSVYLAQGSCMIDVFTLKNFDFKSSPYFASTADQITVTPLDTQNAISLRFERFTVGSYEVDYFIDPPPTIIIGEQVAVDPVSLITVVCGTAVSTTVPCFEGNYLGTLTANTANPVSPVLTFPPRNMLGLMNTFTVDSGTGGFINNTLLDRSAPGTATPEPASMAFTGLGLVGLLAFRSRTKALQVIFQLLS